MWSNWFFLVQFQVFLNRFWTFKSDVPITIGLYKYFNAQLFCLVVHLTTQIGVTKLFGISEILSH